MGGWCWKRLGRFPVQELIDCIPEVFGVILIG